MGTYSEQFIALTGKNKPHPYQLKVAEHIFARRHLIVRAPTGAGKTLAVLVPFLLGRDRLRLGGMIYVLPLRTLVEAVFEEASALAGPKGLTVAMQTGERADAEFFHDADIIVTTFDQLLSGLLCDPYGLSGRLWNINASAIAGKLVVFDEFHLMEPDRAFVTATFGAELFKELCITIWMTATATSALTRVIQERLDAVEVELSASERSALFEGRGISRSLRTHWQKRLTVTDILQHRGRVLAVVNTVGRAQELFDQIPPDRNALLLHSRFFSDHRREKQRQLKGADLVIATQVIEAGVDISSEVLLTELAPVNALVQRAGRCARFPSESGTVHVYDVAAALPYETADLNAARQHVTDTDALTPQICESWIESAHETSDRQALVGLDDLINLRRRLILDQVFGNGPSGAATYIRRGDDSIRIFILSDPAGIKPQERQAIQVRRRSVRHFSSQAWIYDGENWESGGDISRAYAVALPPSIAGYTKEKGLRLGVPGTMESPFKFPKNRPGWYTLRAEEWGDHTNNVVNCSLERLSREGLDSSFAEFVSWVAKLHDLGKLQDCWQRWARERQAARGTETVAALAHTDYDSEIHRGEPRPPHHAAASALYGASYIENLSERDRTAVLLAVLAHHGCTVAGIDLADRLHESARGALQTVGLSLPKLWKRDRFCADIADTITVSFKSFSEIWPLTAILSRILRLSDQKATADSGNE